MAYKSSCSKKNSDPKCNLRARRAEDAENPIRKKYWLLHRDRVMKVKPIVDSSSPIVLKNIFTSPSSFNRSVTNFVRIERENARMLHRIAGIMEGDPAIDNKLRPTLKCSLNRSRDRQMKLLQITFDNLKMFQRIESVKPIYSRKDQLKQFEVHEKKVELRSYFPLFYKQPVSQPWDKLADNALRNAARCARPQVFFNLETDRQALGQIVIELRADVVPFSAENFRALCTGERGLSYKCTEIHRIIPGILWQGGDVSGKQGRGCGKSIYGDSFPDENFRLKHKEPGTVSMVNAGKDTNASQFLITAKKLDALNGVNVVVGKVVCGMDVLDKISALVTPSGKAKDRVWISKCGQVGDGDDEYEHEGEGAGETSQEKIEGAGNDSGGTDDDDDDYDDDDADYQTLFAEMKAGDTSHAVSKQTVVTENGVEVDASRAPSKKTVATENGGETEPSKASSKRTVQAEESATSKAISQKSAASKAISQKSAASKAASQKSGGSKAVSQRSAKSDTASENEEE